MEAYGYYIISGAKAVEKNKENSACSNELADYLAAKRNEFSYSTGKLGATAAVGTGCRPYQGDRPSRGTNCSN